MPTEQVNDNSISPVYFLPDNKMRLGQGGKRLFYLGREEKGSTPEISVITVCLNDDNYLEKTIQSIIRQLDEKVEYIIIDGGSTDTSLDIIKKYEKSLEYWVSEPDQGISDAFNKGIALCRGKVIGLLNSGDWYEAGTFAVVKKIFTEQCGVGVLCGSLQYWLGNEKAYMTESRADLLEQEMSVTHPTCFVRRDIYLNYGGFNPAFKYAMDYELLLRFHVNGVVFQTIPQIMAHMPHEGVSEQHWLKALVETWKARRKHIPDSLYSSRIYLGYLAARKCIRFAMEKLGLHGMVRFYKERLAPVKKKLPD